MVAPTMDACRSSDHISWEKKTVNCCHVMIFRSETDHKNVGSLVCRSMILGFFMGLRVFCVIELLREVSLQLVSDHYPAKEHKYRKTVVGFSLDGKLLLFNIYAQWQSCAKPQSRPTIYVGYYSQKSIPKQLVEWLGCMFQLNYWCST